MSKKNQTDCRETIDSLQNDLNELYSRVKRAISRRCAKIDQINQPCAPICPKFTKLIDLMTTTKAEESEIESVSKRKCEFDTVFEFFYGKSKAPGSPG